MLALTMPAAFAIYICATFLFVIYGPGTCLEGSSLGFICRKLELKDLSTAQLWIYAHVLGTTVYAGYFYLILNGATKGIRAFTTIGLLVLVAIATFMVAYLPVHLAISFVLMMGFFWGDLWLAKTADADEQHRLRVSSWYISLPGAIAIVVIAVYFWLRRNKLTQMTDGEFEAFVAGSAAFSLFSSNAAFTILYTRGGNVMRVGPPHLILTGVSAGIIAALAFFAAITTTIVPGVAALYPASAFEVVFGIWFGVWGALASYLGLLVAGSYGGWFPLHVGLFLSISDLMMALVPAICFRVLKADAALSTKRDLIVFVVAGIVLASVPGSLYYNAINLWLGVIPSGQAFWLGVISWNVGNFVVIPVIAIPILKTASRFIKRSGLYVPGLFV